MLDHPHTAQSNSAVLETGRDAFYKEVGKLARVHGEGNRSLLATYRATVAAAANGYIDLEKNADKKDEAHLIYAHYQSQFAKKNQSDSVPQQASKLRAFVRGGLNPNFDPIALFDDALRLRQEMVEQEVKVKPETRAMVDVFTAQNARPDTRLTDDEIKGKLEATAKDKDEEAFLRSAVNALEKAFKLNQREETENSIRELTKVLAMVVADAEQQAEDEQLEKLLAKRASRGLSAPQLTTDELAAELAAFA
jgi:hypothetical protein